jgi:carotenoid cleavage dioxygenase-like enzyme
MVTGAVTERNIDPDQYCEFPRINDNFMGLKTRYAYMAGIDENQKGTPFTSEIKFDAETGAMQVHSLGEGCKGGEAIFAPRKNAKSEDDGYVVLFVRDDINQTSECRVIDALDFEGEPVARVQIPHRVPFGFHASWVAK